MTGSEILSYCEKRLGRNVDSDLVLEAINEGLRTIADQGLLYNEIELTVDDVSQKYNMPPDYTYIEKVIKIGEDEDYIYKDYNFLGGQISFEDGGDYIITARRMPSDIENISDELIEIHPMFYNPLKYYTLAWLKENNNFASKGAQVLYKRFKRGIDKASKTLLRSKSPRSWTVIRNA